MSSVSWMAEKSSSELIPMLKNAYHALKDKERDLMLAAEIGKSLLENNIAMKNRYEELLNNTRNQVPTKAITSAAALPTPSSSVLTNTTTKSRYESDSGIDSYHETTDDDDDDDDDDTKGMRFIPSRSTREAMIEVLEQKNMELNSHLEHILEEQAHMDKSNTKKHQQLEQEITALTNSLEIAANKIQELEEMNVKANQRRRGGDQSNHDDEDDEKVDRQMVDELLEQINSLKMENDTTIQSKIDLENKLALTLQDLRKLKEQFDHFQFTKDDHEDLKAAYERQFKHIDELNASVEEHRAMLQKLKERGIQLHSTHNTPAGSCYNGQDTSYPDAAFRNTLLGELETEWLKQQQRHLQPSLSTPLCTTNDSSPPSSGPSMKPSLSSLSLKDLSKFTGQSITAMYQQSEFGMESVLARAAGVDQKTLEEAIRFVDRLEEGFCGKNNNDDDWLLGLDTTTERQDNNDLLDDSINQHLLTMFDPAFPRDGLYPDATALVPVKNESDLALSYPTSFSGRIQHTVRHFFKAVWRWCRFAVILTTAVLISVWNGPDFMLLEN
ncbi:uncharacterized protein BX664DRAFT_285225 [Halteromyces radiatus]|uniref:uncharacterized protein n=1 Tax=Halteromyces radiatus TaxID=101107 RepID=UPI00222046C3|nr:uncharacterized protein BX664DRAFT_285225 [Halteromyces radiatus]KAI8081303.1 hypothetical protein BX664DRAFT_285225 [Halteromyces radiatus]